MEITVDAVLFDNDGVLVDSHREVEQAWRQIADEFDLDTDRLLVELVGRRAVDTLSDHLGPEQCRRATARLEDLEVEMASQTRPLAGAHDLLGQLDGAQWTIVTSAARRLAEARWRGASIRFPDRVVTAEDVANGKPDPEPFLVGAAVLGVDPSRCLVFEDSPSGGEAARAAGAAVVAVGALDWPFAPLARIDDLTRVTASLEADGAITLRA